MKIGDKVRGVRVPSGLPEGEMRTRSLLEMCVGRVFPVAGFQGHLLELEVGEVAGKPACMDSIWIEPEHVEIVTTTE